MKHTLVLYFFLAYLSAMAQEEKGLDFSLLLGKDTIGLIDPLRFEVSILNNGSISKEVYSLASHAGELFFGEVAIEIKRSEDSAWTKLDNCLKSYHLEYSAHGKISVTLMPGNRLKSSMFSCVLPSSLQPGVYQIRAFYKNYERQMGGKFNLYSASQALYINEYDREDKSAYYYLLSLPDPDFIYDPIYFKAWDSSNVHFAERLVREHPASSFTPYAELYLCQAYYLLSEKSAQDKNIDDAVKYIRLSRKFGLSVLKSNNTVITSIVKPILSTQYNYVYTKIFSSIDEIPIELDNEFQTYNKN